MKYRIKNTRNLFDTLDEKYLKAIKEIFGEIETRKVYHNITDENFYIQTFVEVKSVEQLNLLINDVDGAGIIIYKDDDDYTYNKEADKFVYVRKKKYPQEMVIEIYDWYRE